MEYLISYGESYEEDGLNLYAIVSGGSFTPRATARIGQLVLGKGNWQGEQLLQPETMEVLLSDTATTRVTSWQDEPYPIANLGWWLNVDGFFPSLPCDAVVALGNHEQVLLVVPSLELILVRYGGSFEKEGQSVWNALETRLFRPLMETLVLRADDSTSKQSDEFDSSGLGCRQSGSAPLAASLQD